MSETATMPTKTPSVTPLGATEPIPLVPGLALPPGTPMPDGWRLHQMTDGQPEAWPTPPAGIDPEIRRKTLEAVDKAFIDLLPTPLAPTRPKPTALLVNAEWRRLFPNQHSWGDECQVRVSEAFKGKGPQFRFVVGNEGA